MTHTIQKENKFNNHCDHATFSLHLCTNTHIQPICISLTKISMSSMSSTGLKSSSLISVSSVLFSQKSTHIVGTAQTSPRKME